MTVDQLIASLSEMRQSAGGDAQVLVRSTERGAQNVSSPERRDDNGTPYVLLHTIRW